VVEGRSEARLRGSACPRRRAGLTVVAEAGDGAEAVELVASGGVDLAVLDIAMPRMTGLQAAREISRRELPVRMLMLSMYDNEQYLLAALQAGASGYVLKSVVDRDLVAACRAAVRGEPFLHPGAAGTLIRDHLRRGTVPERLLTPREEEVVKLIAEGHSAKEIADTLVISVKTVDRHRANVLANSGATARSHAVRDPGRARRTLSPRYDHSSGGGAFRSGRVTERGRARWGVPVPWRGRWFACTGPSCRACARSRWRWSSSTTCGSAGCPAVSTCSS
jgi:DNA-binding NarL/FixJ family response regulator